MNSTEKPLILAICSGGGHWLQMENLSAAFDGYPVVYAIATRTRCATRSGDVVHWLPDANKDNKLGCLWLLLRVAWLMLRYRPGTVVTTGAAPGYFAIRLGKMMGARTIFVDSIANGEQLSLSARIAQPHAHVTLTQWKHIAHEGGPQYWGAIL